MWGSCLAFVFSLQLITSLLLDDQLQPSAQHGLVECVLHSIRNGFRLVDSGLAPFWIPDHGGAARDPHAAGRHRRRSFAAAGSELVAGALPACSGHGPEPDRLLAPLGSKRLLGDSEVATNIAGGLPAIGAWRKRLWSAAQPTDIKHAYPLLHASCGHLAGLGDRS